MSHRIAPLPPRFIRQVRETGLDDLGQSVEVSVAAGGEPCRDVLRRARPGERILLASFSPFAVAGPYREFGPVFLLAESGESEMVASNLSRLHGANGEYFAERLTLRGYSASERIVDARLVSSSEAEAELQRLFANPEVAFVHARFPVYGCFACRIEREPELMA